MAAKIIKQKIVIELEVHADGVTKRAVEKAINQSIRELKEEYAANIDDNLGLAEMEADAEDPFCDYKFTVKKPKRGK